MTDLDQILNCVMQYSYIAPAGSSSGPTLPQSHLSECPVVVVVVALGGGGSGEISDTPMGRWNGLLFNSVMREKGMKERDPPQPRGDNHLTYTLRF